MIEVLRFPAGLYGVTPDWSDANRLDQAVCLAVAGGMTALQFRHKTASPAQRRELALMLLARCRALNIPLLINDDWQLAQDIGADGVHLGRDDADVATVRQTLGSSMLIGVSCYADLARAQQMLAHDVDYVAFGAMFNSGTKPQAQPAPLTILTQALELVHRTQPAGQSPSPRPAVVAIGGITAANGASVLAAGADSLAVIGGLFLADNIEQTAHQFSALSLVSTSTRQTRELRTGPV
jgi:thiamine-phosphate pyrophosphorylase